MEKRKPELKGVIQTASDSRQKLGDISLWPNESNNPKAPKYIGEMRTSHGTRYRVSLWDNADSAKQSRQRVLGV